MKIIHTPLDNTKIDKLRIGEEVLLSGLIYTARDQAHKRIVEDLKKGKNLPFNLKGAIIYYCGPTQTPKEKIIGSCGPTTSSRMDQFTPILLEKGLKGIVGKGRRSDEVKQAIKRYKAVYFLTYAGCGALLSRYVKKAKMIYYKDLGPEAIYELEVENFPLIVAINTKGEDIYDKKRW